MTNEFNKTTIGILIPTYNRKLFLDQALSSALNQSYVNLEVIVIDNGSTDGTAELMKGIEDSRVKFFVNDFNIGLIGSINKGVGLFAGNVQWCTVLCDDDMLHYRFIESMRNHIAEFNCQSVVLCSVFMIDEKGSNIRKARSAPPVETACDYIVNRCAFNRETFLTGLFFNRQAFENIGGYPFFITGMATDDAFIFSLALKDRLLCCKDAIAYIRMHTGAESQRKSRLVDHIKALHEFQVYIESVSTTGTQISQEMKNKIKNSVCAYVKKLNSSFWIGNVSSILEKKDLFAADELNELYELTKNDRYEFDIRVSVYVYLNKFSVDKEGYPCNVLISMYMSSIRVLGLFAEYCQKSKWMMSIWRIVSKILLRL
jgi:glycosyltransferase involved in cell wall biosynthesis